MVAAIVVALATVTGVAAALLVSPPRDSTDVTGAYAPPRFVRNMAPGGPGALEEPLGLVVDGGRLYVADAGRGEVVVLSASGAYRSAFGRGVLSVPLYVALNPLDQRLYVSDRGLRSIAIFEVDGSTGGTFAPDAGDASAVSAVAAWQPLAIAFGPDGTMYVSDAAEPKRVLAFDPSGRLAASSETEGAGAPGLSFVNGIALVGDHVIVTDSNNSRLVVLDRDLRPVSAAGCPGLPRGIAALPAGWPPGAVVAETAGGRLALVDETGTPRSRTGGEGDSEGRLRLPTGVAMDGTGLLYVTDAGDRSISVWRVAEPARVTLVGLVLRDPGPWIAAGIALLGTAVAILLVRASRNAPPAV
jgi:DNA-binding beta-propeller fold protein YncE